MSSSLFADRYQSVVAVLVDARREAGVTQTVLARRLAKPQSYVSKVERRERRIDPIEFFDWARALGVEPTALFARLAARLS